jgi:hypothetical protein
MSAMWNQSQVATTAIYNSKMPYWLPRSIAFASQYIKGVDIECRYSMLIMIILFPEERRKPQWIFRVSKSVFDDRLSFEVGGDFDISQDQSGARHWW